MSLYNYVETPNTNLVCCICRAPFTDPITTRTCTHTFCSECILRALTHSALCPIDRSPLSVNDLVDASPIVRSLVDELVVECPHLSEGCSHTSQRQAMPLHLRDECEYGEVGCLVDGCTEVMKRKDIPAHVEKAHADSEMHSGEEGQEEEGSISRTESEEHTCPHAGIGCPYTGPLKASEHLESCPYESLKGFFVMNTARMSLLTEQNMLLRHRVDTLESTVFTLRREMNAAKNALGPWFRSSYHGMGGYSVVGSEVAGATAGPSESGGGVDELSPYFPSEEVGLRHRASSSVSEGMYGGIVAPLDLGTTLEGTLVGLRESMVGLAAGVDSAGRRSEIALANETLRLGEEMMSVRAQMHGLRMQVHGMMMDRNAALREEGYGNFGMAGSITKL
ncbi:hypothetical protein M413DRAFT_441891 [Hebeloma cylindrosporum]|uniref:RING-type domain-containing protein n=1 Tax=Hebeloma cylindrosporum TaxID=76867 RepID=A0A0C3CN66_HEBCY|nr:hypothetical protein M413DRAFT_441891 [Hebeloma cylindrosporum h7]